MTAKSAQTEQKDAAAGSPADAGRLAADLLQASSANPFLTNPAMAFAAATAIGFGFSTRMAGAFFGALQGAVDATSKMAAALEEQTASKAAPVERAEPMPPKTDAVAKAPVAEGKVAEVKVAEVKQAKVKPSVAPAVRPKVKPAAKVVADMVAAKTTKAAPKGGKTAAANTDDLKLISGVGPKLEQVLNERGVRSFADIAAWTAEDVARFDAELGFEGRIVRDDWIGQAKGLAAKR